MNGRTPGNIWVFAEQRNGVLQEVSLELLGKARELAEGGGFRVSALLAGHQIGRLSRVLISRGADEVLVADDHRFSGYRLLPYAVLVADLARRYQPSVLLVGATPVGMELAPRVAAKLGTGLSAHCIDLRIDEQGRLIQVVPGWEGGVIATITCPECRPQMATVMPGAMKALPPADRKGEVTEVTVELPVQDLGPELLEEMGEVPEGLPLEKAEVVVAGGWGIGSPENWKMIDRLAEVLGGAVGATRPPVDEGWVPEGRMIGQSGKTVRPRVYIGVGISGVMHHVVGMDQSGHVVCINSDPRAEIFQISDLIVVGDFKKILPALIREIEARKNPEPASGRP